MIIRWLRSKKYARWDIISHSNCSNLWNAIFAVCRWALSWRKNTFCLEIKDGHFSSSADSRHPISFVILLFGFPCSKWTILFISHQFTWWKTTNKQLQWQILKTIRPRGVVVGNAWEKFGKCREKMEEKKIVEEKKVEKCLRAREKMPG